MPQHDPERLIHPMSSGRRLPARRRRMLRPGRLAVSGYARDVAGRPSGIRETPYGADPNTGQRGGVLTSVIGLARRI